MDRREERRKKRVTGEKGERKAEEGKGKERSGKEKVMQE